MVDGKDGDGKRANVNIQTNTDSIANPDTMFEKIINNLNKSLEIVIEDSSSPVKRHNTHYIEMSLLDTFYQDYMDFKNHIRDILDARYTNVAAENELVSYSWTIKLATLEEKINALLKEDEHLKGEIESYQKVIQLMATETSNKKDKNVWKTMSNESQRIRNTNLVNEIDHLAMPLTLNNVYEPLDVDFHRENSNEHDDESLKEIETQRSTSLSKKNNIQRVTKNRKRPEHSITEKYRENQHETPRRKIVPGNRSYASTTDYGKKIFVVGDSHIKIINRKRFNNSFEKVKSFIKSFPGAKIQKLEHYVIPHLSA